ncbi:MAG: hypothetical protein LC772_06715 [Chloroflexi bacterium]|nr:hypothetical protein [Chloroflexota bacterium]
MSTYFENGSKKKIEAVQWTGDNVDEVARFLKRFSNPVVVSRTGKRLFCTAGFYEFECNPATWIVFYPWRFPFPSQFYLERDDAFRICYTAVQEER